MEAGMLSKKAARLNDFYLPEGRSEKEKRFLAVFDGRARADLPPGSLSEEVTTDEFRQWAKL